MNDHETMITKSLEEERKRLKEEEWENASLFDKFFGFIILLAIIVIVVGPIYTIFQLIQLNLK